MRRSRVRFSQAARFETGSFKRGPVFYFLDRSNMRRANPAAGRGVGWFPGNEEGRVFGAGTLNRVFATVTQHMAGTRKLGERTMRQPGHQRRSVQRSAGRLAVALVAAAVVPAGLVACTIDTEASNERSAQQAASTETQTSLAAEEEAMQMPNPTPPNKESAMPDSANPDLSLIHI